MSNLPLLLMPTRDVSEYVGLFFDMRGPALPKKGKVATHLVAEADVILTGAFKPRMKVLAFCLRTGEECTFVLRPWEMRHRVL